MIRFALALLIVLLSGCTCYDRKNDLSYDPQNVPFGVFDEYRPKCEPGPHGYPVVILIHGGAWMGGDKNDMHKVAEDLTCHGYLCFSPNYRLTSDYTMPDGHVVKGSPWPAQYDDLEKFLTFLWQNHSLLKVDPDRIASLGISAGGHLAQMLHLHPGNYKTKTACDLDGETDLTPPGNQVMTDFDNIMSLMGGIKGNWTDLAARTPAMQAICVDLSTVPRVTKDSKILIIHGERDPNIFVDQADRLAIALKNAGADYDYVRLSGSRGECHGNCWEDDGAHAHLIAWLDKYLK